VKRLDDQDDDAPHRPPTVRPEFHAEARRIEDEIINNLDADRVGVQITFTYDTEDGAPTEPGQEYEPDEFLRWCLLEPAWNERPGRDHLLVLDGPARAVEHLRVRILLTRSWFPTWLKRSRPSWTAARRTRAGRIALLWLALNEGRALVAYNGPNLDSVYYTPSRLSYDDLCALALAGDDALEKAIAEEARGRRRRQPCRGLLAKAVRERRLAPERTREQLFKQVVFCMKLPRRTVVEAVRLFKQFREPAWRLLEFESFRKHLPG
jgi:hypothetical protein